MRRIVTDRIPSWTPGPPLVVFASSNRNSCFRASRDRPSFHAIEPASEPAHDHALEEFPSRRPRGSEIATSVKSRFAMLKVAEKPNPPALDPSRRCFLHLLELLFFPAPCRWESPFRPIVAQRTHARNGEYEPRRGVGPPSPAAVEGCSRYSVKFTQSQPHPGPACTTAGSEFPCAPSDASRRSSLPLGLTGATPEKPQLPDRAVGPPMPIPRACVGIPFFFFPRR